MNYIVKVSRNIDNVKERIAYSSSSHQLVLCGLQLFLRGDIVFVHSEQTCLDIFWDVLTR